jgi:hypothetical protein
MPRYCHEDPTNGRREYYSAEDCAAIAVARQSGFPVCPVSDVRLPNGRVLRFEVRFGSGLLSSKMSMPSPTGIVQVNIDNQNTRVVHQEPDLPSAAPAREQPTGYPGPVGGASPAYFHIDPTNDRRVPFSEHDNAAIFGAQNAGLPAVPVSPVNLPNGAVLRFEVRFGANARSAKMPSLSYTGICQVNLANENTRIVERVDKPAPTPAPAPKPAPKKQKKPG